MSKGGRGSAGESHWRAVMSRFAGAGVSASAFCRAESIAPQTFYYWRTRLRRSQTAVRALAAEKHLSSAQSPSPRGFVDLGTLSDQGALEIRLELGAGIVLQIRRG